MEEPWKTVLTTGIATVLAFFLNWIFGAKDRADRKRLREIEERGNAPFLIPLPTQKNRIFTERDQDEMIIRSLPGSLNCGKRSISSAEKDNTEIRIPLKNDGKACRYINISSREKSSKRMKIERNLSCENQERYTLVYPYFPEKDGDFIAVYISFESVNGYQGSQRYFAKHGHFVFFRAEEVGNCF